MPRASHLLLVGLMLAAGCQATSDAEDQTQRDPMPCIEGSLEVDLGDPNPAYAELHEAVLGVPRSYVTTATWYGEATPIEVTTTLTHASDSYTVHVLDQAVFCSFAIDLPVHVRVETSDGVLLVDVVSEWALARITETDARAGDIVLGVRLSADPQEPGWLGASVAQMWPDIASAEDDAELMLMIERRSGGVVWGVLAYEKREIIDATTVIYDVEVLLEWSS